MPATDINLSIRWKLAGAFTLTAAWPVIGLATELPPALVIITAVVLALLLAWYSSSRILGGITRVSAHLGSELDHAEHRDELAALEHAFEHLVKAASDLPVPHSDAAEPQQEYYARLGTGSAVCAQAVLFPEPDPERLLLRANVTGDAARKALQKAIHQVVCELRELMASTTVGEITVLEFQELTLQDHALAKFIDDGLADGGLLVDSVEEAFGKLRRRFERMESSYMQARALDCDDLRKRLITAIMGGQDKGDLEATVTGKIVLCQQILLSEIVALARCEVAGIVSLTGTAASHSEIFGIPALSHFEDLPMHALAGREVLLDPAGRRLVVDPDSGQQQVAESAIAPPVPDLEPAFLQSGERIVVGATINNVTAEADLALGAGADEVGLFRTEIDYISGQRLPSEPELAARYQQLNEVFAGREVGMRMLDLGGDKLPLGQQTHEDNPCMGNRSMRLLLSQPSLFRTQFRAMLQAAQDDSVIIFPMISGWYELRQIRRHIDSFIEEFREEGHRVPRLRYGLMLEVPSVIERFEDYVEAFDVFNIGTNDLTQYTLAADRNNEHVVPYYKCYHPSLLTMIRRVCELASAHNKVVCVCGEMANDLRLLPLLIGLGVRRLSVPARRIAALKARVRELDLNACQAIADSALACRSTCEVEELLAG